MKNSGVGKWRDSRRARFAKTTEGALFSENLLARKNRTTFALDGGPAMMEDPASLRWGTMCRAGGEQGGSRITRKTKGGGTYKHIKSGVAGRVPRASVGSCFESCADVLLLLPVRGKKAGRNGGPGWVGFSALLVRWNG